MSNNPNKWKMRVDDATDEIIIEVDQPTAHGKIILRPDIYGITIVCPEIDPSPIAFLDLWNRARGRQCSWPWNEPMLTLQVLSPKQTEDPLAFVEFYQGDTVVSFDTMAQMADDPECDETTVLSNKVFGFFGLPNYPTG